MPDHSTREKRQDSALLPRYDVIHTYIEGKLVVQPLSHAPTLSDPSISSSALEQPPHHHQTQTMMIIARNRFSHCDRHTHHKRATRRRRRRKGETIIYSVPIEIFTPHLTNPNPLPFPLSHSLHYNEFHERISSQRSLARSFDRNDPLPSSSERRLRLL